MWSVQLKKTETHRWVSHAYKEQDQYHIQAAQKNETCVLWQCKHNTMQTNVHTHTHTHTRLHIRSHDLKIALDTVLQSIN